MCTRMYHTYEQVSISQMRTTSSVGSANGLSLIIKHNENNIYWCRTINNVAGCRASDSNANVCR